jgi:hypothetical protein
LFGDAPVVCVDVQIGNEERGHVEFFFRTGSLRKLKGS